MKTSFGAGMIGLVVLGTALTVSASASAADKASSPVAHPDPAGFDIPILPAPASGFGTTLDDACKAVGTLPFTAPAAPPTAANLKQLDANTMVQAAGELGLICQNIKNGTDIDDTQLNALRSFEDTGVLPSIVVALQGEAAAQEAVANAEADAVAKRKAADQAKLNAAEAQKEAGTKRTAEAKAKADDSQKAADQAEKEATAAEETAEKVRVTATRLDGARMVASAKAASGRLEGEATATPAVSGLESNVINGLADFLVTRSKEEAILYLQGEIAGEFCKDDGLTVLPNTCAAIKALDPSLSVAAIGAELNAAARRDLTALPDGVLQVAATHDPSHLYVYEPLRMVYAVGLAAHGGRMPIELVRSLHAVAWRTCESTTDATAVDKTTSDVLKIIRFSSALVYAGQASQLDQLGKLPLHSPRAVGVLIQAEALYGAPDELAPGTARRKFVLTPAAINDATKLLAALNGLAGTLKEWQGYTKTLTNSDGKLTSADLKRVLGTTLSDVIVRSVDLVHKVAPSITGDKAVLAAVGYTRALGHDVAAVSKDVANDDFGALPVDASALIDLIKSKLKLSDDVKKVILAAQKYAPLVSELATAKSSADVATALQAAAAPPDSYRAKYQRTQVSVNGLVGMLVAYETPSKPSDPSLGKSEKTWAFAGFAPVGVEATVPLGSCLYLGLMGSVLDLGALTTARFKSKAASGDQVTTTTNVTIGQVFSPGGYVLLGIFKSPFVIGGGVSYTPSLRTVQSADTTEKLNVVRAGGFLAADVSILPL